MPRSCMAARAAGALSSSGAAGRGAGVRCAFESLRGRGPDERVAALPDGVVMERRATVCSTKHATCSGWASATARSDARRTPSKRRLLRSGAVAARRFRASIISIPRSVRCSVGRRDLPCRRFQPTRYAQRLPRACRRARRVVLSEAELRSSRPMRCASARRSSCALLGRAAQAAWTPRLSGRRDTARHVPAKRRLGGVPDAAARSRFRAPVNVTQLLAEAVSAPMFCQ